jgi:hypothetical protein
LVTFIIIFSVAGMMFYRKPGCTGAQEQQVIPVDARTVEVKIDRWRVIAEVADTPELRAMGLMERPQIQPGYGMLFVFEESDVHAFWMKNTPTPLSIAFIEEGGRIARIARMQPNDITRVSSVERVKYALEVRQGWFEDHGIEAGAEVHIPPIPPAPLVLAAPPTAPVNIPPAARSTR